LKRLKSPTHLAIERFDFVVWRFSMSVVQRFWNRRNTERHHQRFIPAIRLRPRLQRQSGVRFASSSITRTSEHDLHLKLGLARSIGLGAVRQAGNAGAGNVAPMQRAAD
jgi:hypothetical protein